MESNSKEIDVSFFFNIYNPFGGQEEFKNDPEP